MQMHKWPPPLPEEQKSKLENHAITWATMNSLIVKFKSSTENNLDERLGKYLSIHAPFALFPSPFPRTGFELAVKIQPLFNILVERVANDAGFLSTVMKSLGDSDEFTSRIYDIYCKTIKETQQDIVMGIHRSDYLVHYDTNNPTPFIKQVELNTIAASFSSLSQHTSALHKFLSDRTEFYNDHAPGYLDIKPENLPENTSGCSIAEGLAKAWDLYGCSEAVVMMVVQPEETNIFDQIWIEQQLFLLHKIKLVRKTLAEINTQARLVGAVKKLFVGEYHVAVTYYRAGYSPSDYPSELEWNARLVLEQSFSVKCPNAAYHLAGAKKVQQMLAMPNMLERFMSPEHSRLLRLCFTGLYPLDSSKEGLDAYKSALETPEKYVLKPQREGGGNNYYGQDVKLMLEKMSVSERNGYILMDLIKPPPLRNSMVRRGKTTDADVISELGIYGIFVSQGGVIHLNKQGGFLLRTKSSDSNEGGVAAGFAVLDSPLLVD